MLTRTGQVQPNPQCETFLKAHVEIAKMEIEEAEAPPSPPAVPAPVEVPGLPNSRLSKKMWCLVDS